MGECGNCAIFDGCENVCGCKLIIKRVKNRHTTFISSKRMMELTVMVKYFRRMPLGILTAAAKKNSLPLLIR